MLIETRPADNLFIYIIVNNARVKKNEVMENLYNDNSSKIKFAD